MPRYPFTPELLDALPEELAGLFRGLELKLLREIVERLKIRDNLNEVTVQDIRALRSHGISLDEIEKAIRETAGISQEKLTELLDDVVARNQAYYKELVTLSDVTEPQFYTDQEDTWAIYEQTRGQLRNITQSIGFLARQGRHMVMLPPAKAYQHCLDAAEMEIQSGAISYTQAIQNAVRQLADSGLKVVDYESGHHNQVDVAVRRAVMSGINALNQKYREQSMDYLETDLVETTAHLGARNIGEVPNNHEEWQGFVYRWAAKPKTSTGNYPDFEEVCGYGLGEGIGGWNCRHSFFPFIEGVSERTHSDEELELMKAKYGKFNYEGKEYDRYSSTQQQRKIEAEIRHWKRREAASITDDDKAAAKTRLRRLNKKYREFSKAAGLPEQRDRMKVLYT